MKKLVNGVEVDMSPEEIAEREAEEAAWANRPVPLPDLLPYQFRAMLMLSGKSEDLIAFIDGLQEPAKTIAKAKLEFTLAYRRDNDLVETARQGLGMTSEELDALWLQAAAIA